MNKKLTGIVAGAAGAALLLSGATYALWSDSATVDGGTIASGNLDVAVLESAWVDASDDRTDNPHDIDLTSFKIIPGDTIVGSFGFDVGLEGDNMLAALSLAGGGLAGDLADGLTVEYAVVDGADNEVATSSGTADGLEVELVSADNSNPGTVSSVPATTDGTADFVLSVTVTFDENVSDQDLVQTQAALAEAGVQLEQVRSGNGFN